MQLRDGETQNVVNPLLQIWRFTLGSEVFENVRLRNGEIDAAEIENIIKVRGRAIRDHRQYTQIVAIVEHLAQLIGESHVGAVDETAGNAHGPGILALPDDPV